MENSGVEIKSSQAVKSGTAVKIAFTWGWRLRTPRLPVPFKDNAQRRSEEHRGYRGSDKSAPKPSFKLLAKIKG